jgi:Fe2+ or Zn2+ uptake regulation protein
MSNMHQEQKRKRKTGYSAMIESSGIPWLFKNLGYKLTKPREEILTVIYNAQRPLTADEIKSQLKKIEKATLYRALEFFTKFRLILKIDLGKDAAFYEMNDSHHHHIICKKCGDIEEFEACELPNPMISSKKFSFINDHSLEFFGKCKNCV